MVAASTLLYAGWFVITVAAGLARPAGDWWTISYFMAGFAAAQLFILAGVLRAREKHISIEMGGVTRGQLAMHEALRDHTTSTIRIENCRIEP